MEKYWFNEDTYEAQREHFIYRVKETFTGYFGVGHMTPTDYIILERLIGNYLDRRENHEEQSEVLMAAMYHMLVPDYNTIKYSYEFISVMHGYLDLIFDGEYPNYEEE